MNLCRVNQQPSDTYIKYNRLQPKIEPVAKDLNLRAVLLDAQIILLSMAVQNYTFVTKHKTTPWKCFNP